MVSDDNGWALERPQPRVPDSDGGSGFAAQYAAGRLAARGRPAGSGNSIPEQRQRGWVSSRPPSEGMMSHGEAADLSQIRDFNAQDSVLSTAPKPPPPPPPRQRSRHSLELPPPGFTEPPRPQASLPQAQRMEVSSSQSPINAPSASAEFWAQQQQQVLRTCRQGSASAGDLNNDHWTSLQAQATAPLPASQHQQQSWQQLYAQASHSKSMPDLVVPQQKQEQTWGQQDAQAAHIPTGYGSGAAAAAAQAAAQVMAQLQAAQASPALQQPHPTFALHHGHEHIYSGGSVDTAPRGTPIAGASPSSLYLALQQHRGLLCGGLDLTTVHALQHLYQQQQQQQHSKQMPDQQQSDGMSQAWGSHTLQGHAIPGYEYGAPQPQPQTQPHMAWAVEQHDQLHHHHAGYEQGAPGLQVLHEEAIMSQRPGLHRIQPTTLPLPFEPPTGSILQASIQTMPKGLEHDPSSAGHITLPGQLHQMPAASGDDPQLHYPRSSPSSLQLAEASFSFSQPRASMVPVGVSLEVRLTGA